MRFKAALFFWTILLHEIMLQWCYGERIEITGVDSATKEEVSFLKKNAQTFEQIGRDPAFLNTLPYLHYLCSAMLRPPANRKSPSASPPPPSPNQHLLSNTVPSPTARHLFSKTPAFPANRRLLSSAMQRQLSSPGSEMGVSYLREWARKEMFGKMSYVRMNIIQSVMNGMCKKVYSTPEGEYLLQTHKIRYKPDSLHNKQPHHLNSSDEENEDIFTDLETELKNLKPNANSNFRGSEFNTGKESNQTSQIENIRQPGVTLDSEKPKKLNRTLVNMLSRKNSKVVPKSDKDETRSKLEKLQETPSVLVSKGEIHNETYSGYKTRTESKESGITENKVKLENRTGEGDNSDTLKKSVSEGKLQNLSIQPETSNMKNKPQSVHSKDSNIREGGLTKIPGKDITETTNKNGQSPAKFESKGIVRQNGTIRNNYELNKFEREAESLGKSVSEETVQPASEVLSKHDRKQHPDGVSVASDMFNGKIRPKARNATGHRNILKTSLVPSESENDGDNNDNEQLNEDEDELVRNLESKLKELKPDADASLSAKGEARNEAVVSNTTLSQEAVESDALGTNESTPDVHSARGLRTFTQPGESTDPEQDQATRTSEDKVGNISKRDDRSNPNEAIHRENLSSEERQPNNSSFETKTRSDLEVTPTHVRKYEHRNTSDAAVKTQIDSDDFDSKWDIPEANETQLP